MREHWQKVAGEDVVVNVVEREEDLTEFRNFVRANLRCLAADTETTGVKMYAPGFSIRTVQLGTPKEAYVLPVERGAGFMEDARLALRGIQRLIFHNGMFDLQVIERTLGIRMEDMWPKVWDTRILSHLVDPRGREEGGIGHGLEELVRYYVDPRIAEDVKKLPASWAKELKTTKSKMWATIDIDHPGYSLYAGMDPILAARLYSKVLPKVPAVSKPLIEFEHKVAEICSYMERTGFLLDREYTRGLSERLRGEETKYTELAAEFGCENVNSTEQVADVLESRGVKIPDRTPTGKRKVDKILLDKMVEREDPFAIAVKEAKKARKWRTTWVDNFLAEMDENGRCHANINALRARTARMSITGIPAQTLPSGDFLIRRCFIADPGQVIAAADYQTQELRVLAALAKDKVMQKAFRDGADLHLMTARAAFGDHITKDDKERKYAKVVNFGRVYGGGAKTVAAQTGIDLQTAKKVVEGFDNAYPGVARYSKSLADQARRQGHITTPSGRRLPVDPERSYAALNYMVQSTSRDVTCRGLVKLHKAGFTPYLRLPIHDEIVASVPAEKADWGIGQISKYMAEDFAGVQIGTDAEVYGLSWGHGYGAEN